MNLFITPVFFVVLLVLAVSPSLSADDDADDNIVQSVVGVESESSSVLDGMGGIAGSAMDVMGDLAEGAQRVTHNGFNRFVVQVDDFFGSADATDEENTSWGRIRLGVLKPPGESLEFKSRLKIRLVLPQTESRLRLLFSTEDTDITGSERRGSIDNESDKDAALALRFVRSLSDKLRLKFDIGVRSRDSKIQIFGRISASNSRKFASGWEYQISNNFFLFSASGFENRFRVDIRKPIFEASNVFFRSSLSIEARNGFRGASVSEVAGFYAELSPKEAIAFEGLFSFVTSRDDEFDTRYLGTEFRIRYRRNVWRPWFYYEIWPTASILAATDRELEFGGLLRAEILFGKF